MSQPSTAEDLPSFRPFATFALVWACATLVHQLAFTFWTETWQGWVLVFAAVICVFRPDCLFRFGFLVVAELLNLLEKMPFVPNHVLFEGMLHLTMLLGLVGWLTRNDGRSAFREAWPHFRPRLPLLLVAIAVKALYYLQPVVERGYLPGSLTSLFLIVAICRFFAVPVRMRGGDELFHSIAPVLRAAIVIVYFWAALQKLNWDYFDPEVSCAATLHRDIASYFFGAVPTSHWALYLAIWSSLALEILIPVLLCFRRTRYLGFVVALWFHLWLSIHPAAGIYGFSSLILSALVWFLPATWGDRLEGQWQRQARWIGGGDGEKGRVRAAWLVTLVFFGCLVAQGTLYLTMERSYAVFQTANRVGFWAFLVWGCWIAVNYLVAGAKAAPTLSPLPNRFRLNIACLGLILVLTNGIHPWIGGRTQTSFSMYSNLRSEGESNHLFLRRIDLLPFQRDMVEILDSAPNILEPTERPRGIQQFANPGHTVLPWFEFRRLVSEHEGDFVVTYRRRGETVELGRNGEVESGDPAAFEPIPLLMRKFLWFRRLDTLDEPMVCTH